MPKQATTMKPEMRLSIRTDSDQKSLLARAAAARHMNVSQFVLGATLREAEQVINDESQIVLSAEEYDWLVKALDEPPVAKPQLRERLSRKPPWDV